MSAPTSQPKELRRALLPIGEAFKRWEQGGLGSGDLSELIHRFHPGPARELYVRYDTNQLEAPVAYAIVRGALDRKAVPAEVLDHVAAMIEQVKLRAMRRDSGCAWVASGAAFRLGMQRVSAQHTEATICSVLPQQVQHRPRHRGAGVLRAQVVQELSARDSLAPQRPVEPLVTPG